MQLPVEDFENEDCAVSAAAVLSGLPYPVAHARFAKFGRVSGEATEWEIIELAFKDLGIPLRDPITFDKPPTVRRLIRDQLLPEGKFLIYITGHVFPLVDGRTNDWAASTRYRVREAWRV